MALRTRAQPAHDRLPLQVPSRAAAVVRALDARQAALGRHSAPPFVMLDGIELISLRRLSDLAFRLFLELVAMDREGSGRIATTYAVLMSLLDFDQAPCAHAADKPTLKRIRTALEHLASVGLVRLDRARNELGKGLFLRVKTREEMSAARAMKGSMRGRREKPAKQATARPSAKRGGDEGQTEGQGFQEGFSYPPTPQQSTGPRAAFEFVADALNPVPPRGQDTHAPAAHTPPTRPNAHTLAVRAVVDRKKAKDKALRANEAGLELASAAGGAGPKKTV